MPTATLGANTGVVYNVNGTSFDGGSPEGQRFLADRSRQFKAKREADIEGDLGLEKTKAIIAVKEDNSAVNTALSAARQDAARGGGGTRGMNRRTYRQKGGSAFSAIGKLAKANAATRIADVSGYFDQATANEKRKIGVTSTSPTGPTKLLPP